jgi:hypothetical protein
LNVDTSVDRLSPILAFDILQSYFVKVERPKKMELLSPIVNSKTLKDAMIETYKQFHFKELITQKVDDADRKKGNIVTTLVSNLNTGKITDDLFPLYDPKVVGEEKLKEIKILDGPTLEKIGRDEKWKNLKAQGVALGAVTVNKLKIPEINNVHN